MTLLYSYSLEAPMELATCNVAPRCLAHALDMLHVTRTNITLKVWLEEGVFILYIINQELYHKHENLEVPA